MERILRPQEQPQQHLHGATVAREEVGDIPQVRQESAAEFYVVFELQHVLYAAKTAWVKELITLPELTLVSSAPSFIVGVLNLRGKLVPVIDLNLRQGRPRARYGLDNHVVVLQHDGTNLGLIVNGIQDVRAIARDAVPGGFLGPQRWHGQGWGGRRDRARR